MQVKEPKYKSYLPWVEKYRPKEFKDISGHGANVMRLAVIAKCGNMPNILLAGPPGTGKTTTIKCLAKILLKENYNDAVLELNASNDRGIDVVRGKIKLFAQKSLKLLPHQHKIIILDEADSMTESAQQALRRTMEIYSKSTRFALACNYSDKIIDPIQSRCAVIRFSRLEDEFILKRILEIVDLEKLTYDNDGLNAILFTAEGDMRRAINNLQATNQAMNHISSANVFKVCDEPPPDKIEKMLSCCLSSDIDGAINIIQALWNLGYCAEDILNIMLKVVSGNSFKMQDIIRMEYIKVMVVTKVAINDGLTNINQLYGLVAKMCIINCKTLPSQLTRNIDCIY